MWRRCVVQMYLCKHICKPCLLVLCRRCSWLFNRKTSGGRRPLANHSPYDAEVEESPFNILQDDFCGRVLFSKILHFPWALSPLLWKGSFDLQLVQICFEEASQWFRRNTWRASNVSILAMYCSFSNLYSNVPLNQRNQDNSIIGTFGNWTNYKVQVAHFSKLNRIVVILSCFICEHKQTKRSVAFLILYFILNSSLWSVTEREGVIGR